MSKVKKIVISVVSLVLVLCLAAGGIFTYKWYSAKKNPVSVIPVSYINNSWYGDYYSGAGDLYGTISKGMSQNVYYNSELSVKEMLVKEGDVVEIGTPLISYDTTLLNLQIQRKENEIQTIDLKIEALQKRITELKKMKPVADAGIISGENGVALMAYSTGIVRTVDTGSEDETGAVETTPSVEVLDVLTDKSVAYKGSGSTEDPFCFRILTGTVIEDSFITKAVTDKCVCRFEVVGEDISEVVLYSWIFDGAKVMEAVKESIVPEPTEPETEPVKPTEPATEPDDPVIDDPIDDPIIDDPIDDPIWDDPIWDGPIWDDPIGMTKEEIAKEISDAEEEIKSLGFDRKAAEIALQLAQNKLTDGTLLSTVNGIVGEIFSEEEAMMDGKPILTVTATEGTYLKGYIGENNLGSISKGQTATIMSYYTGNYYTAQITEISDMASEEYAAYGGNQSYYEFTAVVEDGDDMNDYEDVQITLSSDGGASTGALYIEKAYVREENGIHYVYIAGDDGKLRKQPVKTGRIMDGYAIEIFEGLFESDLIAFPYGKNVKEGAPVVEDDGSSMYY